MIAIFRAVLPFVFHRPADELLAPQLIQIEEFELELFPPVASCVDRRAFESNTLLSFDDLIGGVRPADPQASQDNIKIDGRPAVAVDLVEIRCRKEDFDRNRTPGADPRLLTFCFLALNSWLIRFRAVSRFTLVQQVGPKNCVFRFEFRKDDGSELRIEEGKYRRNEGAPFRYELGVLNRELWNRSHALPGDYKPDQSNDLLIEANGLLAKKGPALGPALVLANTAIEIRIEAILGELAPSKVPKELWHWIMDRGDYRKEPSVIEECDVLLKVMTGQSMKSQRRLWDEFMGLRKARNAFVHDGEPKIGNNPVSVARAAELLRGADEILTWLDSLLPEEKRVVMPLTTVTTEMELFRAPAASSPGQGTSAMERA